MCGTGNTAAVFLHAVKSIDSNIVKELCRFKWAGTGLCLALFTLSFLASVSFEQKVPVIVGFSLTVILQSMYKTWCSMAVQTARTSRISCVCLRAAGWILSKNVSRCNPMKVQTSDALCRPDVSCVSTFRLFLLALKQWSFTQEVWLLLPAQREKFASSGAL